MTLLKEKISAARRLLGTLAGGQADPAVTDHRWLKWKQAYKLRRNAVYRTLTLARDRLEQ